MSIHASQNPADPSPDVEEGREAYHVGGFHPVYVGDLYHERYEVLSKIGYGVYSTVWLVKDHNEQLVLLLSFEFDESCV